GGRGGGGGGAGGERGGGRVGGGGGRGGRGGGALALQVGRRGGGTDAAGAADERDQRRRTRAELDRPAGVHARSGRSRELRRGSPYRLGGLPRARGAAPRKWALDGRRRRGWF